MPRVVSWSLLQRIIEQNVGIPVPGVEGESLVFKVFYPDRVQHRCLVLRNAFQSEMWSRSFFLVCLVAAIKISPRTKFILFFSRSSSCL